MKQICLLEALSGKNRIPLTKTKSKEPAGHSPKRMESDGKEKIVVKPEKLRYNKENGYGEARA